MWEYKMVHFSFEEAVANKLNALGLEGWELVAIWGSVNPLFFFKRRKGPGLPMDTPVQLGGQQ